MGRAKSLTSLKGIHKIIKEVNGDIYLGNTPIKNGILGLLMINGVRNIKNTLTGSSKFSKAIKIVSKYLGQGRAGVLSAQEELIDAGLDEFAEL